MTPISKFTAFVVFLPGAVFAASFGISGHDGRRGYDGTSGRSGRDIVVTVDGNAQDLNLSGEDGRPGAPGETGEDAWSCSQPMQPPYNLYGADGGDAGSGGSGGRGGNGGSATIYFQDSASLKVIRIANGPGRGAPGGPASLRGGDACRCWQRYWDVVRCEDYRRDDGSYERRCTRDTFSCSDGRIGGRGLNGSSGLTGSYGRLTLIPQGSPVQDDQSADTLSLGELARGTTLTENQWEERRGARGLFANGSDIPDTYNWYAGQKSFPVTLKWSSARNFNLFDDSQATVIVRSNQVTLGLGDDIWAEVQKTSSSQGTEFNFKKAIHVNEATDLSPTIRGKGRDTQLVIQDAAGVSDIVNSSVTLTLEADNLFENNLFVGAVPAQFVSITKNEIIVKIGRMDIKDKYLESGRKLKAAFQVSRYLGENSLFWNQEWAGKVP